LFPNKVIVYSSEWMESKNQPMTIEINPVGVNGY